MKRFIKKIITTFFTLLSIRTLKSSKNKPKVNGYTRFNSKTILGKNTHFNGLKVLGKGNVRIGDNFHSGSGCEFITDSHNYNGDAIPYDDTYIVKDIIIDNNVWIGRNITVLGGVTIGEGAIIQAGSVVVNDIPKYAIAGGHPAKVFSERNIERYIDLKEKGLFY